MFTLKGPLSIGSDIQTDYKAALVILHSPAISNLFDSSINLTSLMQHESSQYEAVLAITRAGKVLVRTKFTIN